MGTLTIQFKGQALLVYAFATNQFKPYVRELYTLRGDNVLRDAPADHLHHHGLMYAIRVNDVNFWEERDQPGHELSVKLISHHAGKTRDGLPEASFTQLIHWVAHTNVAVAESKSVALLVERRTLTLTVDEARAEVALRWQAEFEVGPAAEKAKLHGSEYNGLGLRLPASWDHVAKHFNSENADWERLAVFCRPQDVSGPLVIPGSDRAAPLMASGLGSVPVRQIGTQIWNAQRQTTQHE